MASGTRLQIDVLVLTAADGEDAALRAVSDGALGDWEQPDPGDPGLRIRRFRRVDGGEIRVAHAHAQAMGETTAASDATRYIERLKPSALAMCGVCAGRPGWSQLGDVVIAEHLFKYDVGQSVRTSPDEAPKFKPDGRTRDLTRVWLGHAKSIADQFPVGATGRALSAKRPHPPEHAELWLLDTLSRKVDPDFGRPIHQSEAAWQALVLRLRELKQVKLSSGRLTLLQSGKARLADHLALHPGGLTPPPWRIHVAPFGTGSMLQRDETIWDWTSDQARHVKAIDMEGAAIGEVGWHYAIEPTLVVKAVMDFAEPGRTQHVREFAARAAAEVLLALLRQHLPARGRTAADVLQTGTHERAPNATNPGALLHPRHEVIDFLDSIRTEEFDALRTWCDDDRPVSARLFFGPGGTGKTRLMIEWARRLRDRDWCAGFLPEHVEDVDLGIALASTTPTLVIIDYAEARRDLVEVMKRVAAARPPTGGKLRVILLAREVADWWRVLSRADTAIEDLLAPFEPRRVSAVPVDGQLRGEFFQAAAAKFANVLSREMPDGIPDLSDHRFGRALYVAMAALAHVERRPIRAESILTDTVARERRLWRHRFEEEVPRSNEAIADFEVRLSRFMAAATLRGGVPQGQTASGLLTRVDGPQQEFVLEWLASVYPHQERKTGRGIAPLEPDLLGEQLVWEALEHHDTRNEFLDTVFEGCPPEAFESGFLVLGRLAARGQSTVDVWIERLIGEEPESRAASALRAVLVLRAETAHAPIGTILARKLDEHGGSTELADAINGIIDENEPSLALRELRLWATQRSLDVVHDKRNDSSARMLHNLGNRLSEIGRFEDALATTEEAVKVFRELADAQPDVYLPQLAASLDSLGNRLGELGRGKDAFAAATEALSIRRQLARTRPGAFLPDLAASLSNLGGRLSELGQRENALAATKEAVSIYRDLVRQNSDDYLPALAGCLNNLGGRLSELGQREDALAVTEESVDIRRELACARPDAFLPDLAASLNNFSVMHSEVGERVQALHASQDAVTIYRALARRQPDAFLSDLAMSLSNLGVRLEEIGRTADALTPTQEAVEIRRELARCRPHAFLQDLAASLNNLGVILYKLERNEVAVIAIQEAVAIRRDLAHCRPGTFLAHLATSLNNLGNGLSDLGRLDEALAIAREAVEIRRELARSQPDAFLPALAASSHNLGITLSKLGQHEEALVVTQEAVNVRRELARIRPATFLADLAASLNNLSATLSELGRRDEALAAAGEGVAATVKLARSAPKAFLQKLEGRANNLRMRLQECDRAPESNRLLIEAEAFIAAMRSAGHRPADGDS